MASTRNLIVTLADRNYIDQAKQLFSSVYWNAGWEGDYMLLAHDIPENELKWFVDKGILIKKCEPLHDKSIGMDYSPIVLDKFYLFTPEFKKWGNIIYLDSDIIVRGSLDKMTKIKGFGAVTSTLKLNEQFSNKTNLFKELKQTYFLNKKSCNTGVIAFSTDIIQEDTLSKLMELFEKYNKIILFADEAVLNLYFYKKWKKLPRVFGLDVILLMNFKIRYNKIKALVMHFIRNEYFKYKPWMTENPFYSEWINNFNKAELIDLSSIQKANKWGPTKIFHYSLLYNYYFHVFYIFHCYKPIQEIRKALIFLIHLPDRIIGFIGIIIKKINPKLYCRIKKFFKIK